MNFIQRIIKLLLFFIPLLSLSQEFTISGRVLDIDNNPVSYANVILMTSDSTIVKGVSSNDKGAFSFFDIESDIYLLKTSFIGYKDNIITIVVNGDLVLEDVILEEKQESLDEITLTYKKPTVKKEADRVVFNIENSALTEGNMLQVLKSTPGVLVLDNNLLVKNTEPTVYINDRKVHLTAAELSQLLEGASANSIKAVEVITNPSAKYDAESGAVINIVMSKNLITGYRGNVFANYTQGVFPRYNAGTSHFFKSEKINFSANYSYTQNKINRNNREEVNFLDDNLDIEETWKSELNRNTWSKTYNFNFNFDYNINEKNTLSLSSTVLWLPDFKYKISNLTNAFDNTESLMFYYDSNSLSSDEKHNIGLDLDYTHLFKNPGEKLSLNAHYTNYDYNRLQDVLSNYYNADDSFIESTSYNTNNNQETEIFTSKADYTLPISDSSLFEAGAKASFINTNSDITQYDIVGGSEVLNPENTDAFDYEEAILAAYVNYSQDWEKFSLALGLRAEQTNVTGVSISNNETNKQDYLEWFPTTSINYIISDNLSFYTNYKRSIQRPDYESLNPFHFFINDNTVYLGNPSLRPVIDNYVDAGFTLNDSYTIQAYYKKSKNNIYELPIQDNETNLVSYVPVNFDNTVEYGFDFILSSYITERWFLYGVFSVYNIEDTETFDTEVLKRNMWSTYSVLQNDFTFLKDKTLNLNLTMYWVGKNLQGLREVDGRLASNLSISKSVFNKKGVISLSAEDLFNRQDFTDRSRYLNQNSKLFTDVDNRYIKIGFRYMFGNTNLSSNSRTSNLQERNRLQSESN
ncbi:outer membrane beta-barrel family protein [Gaetbulibacter jejuensis]|uniref:Outer membrane beta-barrel family protein n=1 Tax=Gaetbulibacter jejuensis TaxID=584607 RepID=A0ABN1JDP2_9FLAO